MFFFAISHTRIIGSLVSKVRRLEPFLCLLEVVVEVGVSSSVSTAAADEKYVTDEERCGMWRWWLGLETCAVKGVVEFNSLRVAV